MKTSEVFQRLGFREDWQAISDEPPVYLFDFGNLEIKAAGCLSRHFTSCFLLSGSAFDGRTLRMIESELPLQIESFEQCVALLAHAIGDDFRPLRPTPWLDDGRAWRDQLPWKQQQREYAARPQCCVEKLWFKPLRDQLLKRAKDALTEDLIWFSFDGAILSVKYQDEVMVVSATGKPWPARYAIKSTQIGHMPKRLSDQVTIDIWKERFRVANRAWDIAAFKRHEEDDVAA